MGRGFTRLAAVFLILVCVAAPLPAPGFRSAPRPPARPHVHVEPPRPHSYGHGKPGRGYEPDPGPSHHSIPDPFGRSNIDPAGELELRSEATRKLLTNEPLTPAERAALERWGSRPSDSTFGGRRRRQATPEEARARAFHNQYLPHSALLAAPANLRAELSGKTAEIAELRSSMRTFHRAIDRLQQNGWNAKTALKQAALAASVTHVASTSNGRRPRRSFDIRPLEQPEPLPPEIERLLPAENREVWQRYAFRTLQGQDVATSLAYVDFLYAASLSGAGKFAEVAKLDRQRLPGKASPEAAALRDLTRALVNDGRVRTAKFVLPLVPVVAGSSASTHRFAAALPVDTVAVAVARAGKEVMALEAVPEWKRGEKLRGAVEGFASSKRTVDVYLRDGDALQVMRVDRKSRVAKLLTGNEAAASFRAHCRAQIRQHSRPGFRLANVLRVNGGYRVVMAGRSIRITNKEAASLSRGERLPPDHPLSRAFADDPSFVVYSHPLMAREGRYRAHADDIAFGVQRSYPEVRVFKDDLSDKTASRAEAVKQFVIGDPSDVVVLKADDSFHVDDAGILKDIAEDLKSAGIQVEEIAPAFKANEPGHTRLVIVISGHINEDLANFVRRAGEAGYFRDNIVAFNSCASDLTSQLVHEVNARYGAVATWRYEGKIPAAKVQEILLKLHDDIQNKPTLDDWKRYVQEEGLVGVWNICFLRNDEAQSIG